MSSGLSVQPLAESAEETPAKAAEQQGTCHRP